MDSRRYYKESEPLLNWNVEEPGKPYKIQHRCFYFSRDIIMFVKKCRYESVFNSLFTQLIRSATSIGANIIEGSAGSSKKDWQNYCAIALKSANESKYWLCLIRDTLEVDKNKVNELITEVDEISKIIASIILNSKEIKSKN